MSLGGGGVCSDHFAVRDAAERSAGAFGGERQDSALHLAAQFWGQDARSVGDDAGAVPVQVTAFLSGQRRGQLIDHHQGVLDAETRRDRGESQQAADFC